MWVPSERWGARHVLLVALTWAMAAAEAVDWLGRRDLGALAGGLRVACYALLAAALEADHPASGRAGAVRGRSAALFAASMLAAWPRIAGFLGRWRRLYSHQAGESGGGGGGGASGFSAVLLASALDPNVGHGLGFAAGLAAGGGLCALGSLCAACLGPVPLERVAWPPHPMRGAPLASKLLYLHWTPWVRHFGSKLEGPGPAGLGRPPGLRPPGAVPAEEQQALSGPAASAPPVSAPLPRQLAVSDLPPLFPDQLARRCAHFVRSRDAAALEAAWLKRSARHAAATHASTSVPLEASLEASPRRGKLKTKKSPTSTQAGRRMGAPKLQPGERGLWARGFELVRSDVLRQLAWTSAMLLANYAAPFGKKIGTLW